MVLVLKSRKPGVGKLQSNISVDGSGADFANEDKSPTCLEHLAISEFSLSSPPVV